MAHDSYDIGYQSILSKQTVYNMLPSCSHYVKPSIIIKMKKIDQIKKKSEKHQKIMNIHTTTCALATCYLYFNIVKMLPFSTSTAPPVLFNRTKNRACSTALRRDLFVLPILEKKSTGNPQNLTEELAVEPRHLRNMCKSNWNISPKNIGKNNKQNCEATTKNEGLGKMVSMVSVEGLGKIVSSKNEGFSKTHDGVLAKAALLKP